MRMLKTEEPLLPWRRVTAVDNFPTLDILLRCRAEAQAEVSRLTDAISLKIASVNNLQMEWGGRSNGE